MVPEPLFTRPLVIFLVVVGLILLRCLDDRAGPKSHREVLIALGEGDLEGAERSVLLRRLVSAAHGRNERDRVVPAAMAAVALGDRERYAELLGGAAVPLSAADDVGILDTAALGDPLLRLLLAAMQAEVRGDRAAARSRYEQVERGSRLWHAPFAAELAAAGLARVH